MTIPTPNHFKITFPSGANAHSVRVPTFANADDVVNWLGLGNTPRPTMFISGGASNMSDEAIFSTRRLIEGGIARFAAEHNIVVIDGGTDVGIMQMVGEARAKWKNAFTLIGCAPEGKITYPTYTPPPNDDNSRTPLEPNHSHFVLVDGDYWGAESDLIVGLTRAITQHQQPNVGILINGGSIAKYDIYIASARGNAAIPVIVLDGSGRTADEIARASRTGKFNSAMLRAIVQGGKIEVATLQEGPKGIYRHLQQVFKQP